ncbi:radical SAM superfamily enzyme, MoaA/NifB/PqqE/SkfB family (SPASM domain) [Campylobacter hyointestinalis subsp. lawsonii CCUG 27631]|uniref:radical SAM/SPASM domain-containing protein n=1 Tax=Campylobacter hyointestinalis TaxID=198 RepID=UPI0007C9D582|nr:radical SAM/SPASM domain-containing protein [Campylobacter hyointestinalis]ANE33465.1 radical SAM superfamily enzyme, MoaA/NifB/PqqE/SkfB family (SPASM domain) [Campylobacter hyointestinalis subsp. lawsonii CCUG 27631]
MNFLNKLKKIVRHNHNLYINLRNLYGFYKGFMSLLEGKKGSIEHIKSTYSLLKKDKKILGKPINITIEPTNVCNAKCPVCETGSGILGRKKSFLSFEDFKVIIDKIAPYTNTLMYYFMGEPFLNKDWVKQVKYAKEKGISFISSCTNGDVKGIPQGIIDSGIDFVSFQMGGTTQETQQIYRVGTNLENIRHNLVETIKLKKKVKSKVHIEAGFILMKHNEHQVDEFIKWCIKIGVDSFNIIDPCVRTIEQGKQYLPTDKKHWIYDPVKFENGILKRRIEPQNDCPWIYYSMTIMVNGDVVPCCHDACGKEVMGNLIEQNLDDVWNGNKFQNFRDRIHNNQRDVNICRLCSGYGVSEIK